LSGYISQPCPDTFRNLVRIICECLCKETREASTGNTAMDDHESIHFANRMQRSIRLMHGAVMDLFFRTGTPMSCSKAISEIHLVLGEHMGCKLIETSGTSRLFCVVFEFDGMRMHALCMSRVHDRLMGVISCTVRRAVPHGTVARRASF